MIKFDHQTNITMEKKKIRILSIDGGGIRGILPGVILTFIEEQLMAKEGPDVRLSDYFDMIAGTSTGGILTCTYLLPARDKDGRVSSRPALTAKEAVNIYLDRGDEIFGLSMWQKIKSKGGLADEKYDATQLEKALKDYFGEDFPLEKEISEKKKVDEEVDKKKYDVVKDKVMNELRKFFRPELINRFDEVIIFEPLKFSDMIKIVKLQLKGVAKLLEEQEIGFIFTDAAVKEVVRAGFDPIFGARPLRRAIQKLIENPISTLIIEKKVNTGDQIVVDFDGENFVFNIEKVELVAAEDGKEVTKKQFLCETCGNKFTTETLATATPVCARCGSTQLQEFVEDKTQESEKKEDSLADEKKPDASNAVSAEKPTENPAQPPQTQSPVEPVAPVVPPTPPQVTQPGQDGTQGQFSGV